MDVPNAVLALDLGGTKLSAALVTEAGEILHLQKRQTSTGLPIIATEAEAAVRAAGSSWDRVRGAGLIVPGIYDPRTGTAWAPNVWGDRHLPIRDELQRSIPVQLRISSDRAGYVLGESWLGAARGLSNVVFVAIGTGIGVGIIAGERLVEGHGGIAGAAGWFALTEHFRDGYATTGCWEGEAAGPAFARRAGCANAEQAAAEARAGDARALQAVEATAEFIGAGVANIISMLNPEMVVLGGGLMSAADLFLDRIRRVAARWAQPVAFRQCRIEISHLAQNAGLLGAARLAFMKD
jgi:glucokinase